MKARLPSISTPPPHPAQSWEQLASLQHHRSFVEGIPLTGDLLRIWGNQCCGLGLQDNFGKFGYGAWRGFFPCYAPVVTTSSSTTVQNDAANMGALIVRIAFRRYYTITITIIRNLKALRHNIGNSWGFYSTLVFRMSFGRSSPLSFICLEFPA